MIYEPNISRKKTRKNMEQNEEIKDVPVEISGAEENISADNAEVVEKAPEEAAAPKVYGDKVLTKAQQRQRTLLRWVLMTVGILMMASSVFFFQTPNGFTVGGVAGIALLLQYAFNNPFLTQGLFIAIINVILIALGLVILGKQCTVRTIYCSLLYTGVIWGFEQLFGTNGQPIYLELPLTGGKEKFMELCYAILLFGIGGALVFNCGSTSGGTDIIAMILKKFTKLNVGVSLLIIDFVVVCISFVSVKPDIALYSMLGLFAKSFLLDGVIESIGKTKYITIITKNPDEIADYILNTIKHSYTIYDAEGGYSKESKKIMITVCKRSEALKLKTKVKLLDPEAFVIITDANEILGKGFGGTI